MKKIPLFREEVLAQYQDLSVNEAFSGYVPSMLFAIIFFILGLLVVICML